MPTHVTYHYFCYLLSSVKQHLLFTPHVQVLLSPNQLLPSGQINAGTDGHVSMLVLAKVVFVVVCVLVNACA